MKKILVFIISILVFSFPIFIISDVIADGKKKDVILSTVDIDEDYEILGLVYYRSGELNPKKINEELTKQAEAMGADYVIGITYYNNLGYLYGTGTAVKLIKKDEN